MPQQKIGFYGKFTPTGVDTSGAQRLQALAQLSSQIGDISYKIGATKAEEAGTKAGLEAGTKAAQEGTPIAPKDSAFSIFGQAYDKAMTNSYVAGLQSNMRQNMSRMSIEAGNDPELFKKSVEGYLSGARSNIDPSMMPYFNSVANDLSSAYLGEVSNRQAMFNWESSKQVAADSSNMLVSDMQRLITQGLSLQALTARDEALASIDMQVGTFINDAEADIAKRNIMNVYTTESMRYNIRSMYNRPNGITDATNEIERISSAVFEGKTPKELRGMTPDAQRAMVDTLYADLKQHISAQNIKESQETSATKARQEAKYVELSTGLITGDYTFQDVMTEARKGSVNSTQFNQLEAQYRASGYGIDDYSTVYNIRKLMAEESGPARARVEVMDATNRGQLSTKTAQELLTEIDTFDSEESILQTSLAKRMRKRILDYNVIPGIGGQLDEDEVRRGSDLVMVFDSRVKNGDDPVIVAQEMISAGEYTQEGFTTVNDVNDRLKQLAKIVDLGKKGDKRYVNSVQANIDEMKRLEKLKSKIGVFNQFQKDLAEAQKGR